MVVLSEFISLHWSRRKKKSGQSIYSWLDSVSKEVINNRIALTRVKDDKDMSRRSTSPGSLSSLPKKQKRYELYWTRVTSERKLRSAGAASSRREHHAAKGRRRYLVTVKKSRSRLVGDLASPRNIGERVTRVGTSDRGACANASPFRNFWFFCQQCSPPAVGFAILAAIYYPTICKRTRLFSFLLVQIVY